MSKLEPLVVYWSPNFPLDEGYFDWNILYNNPESVINFLKRTVNKNTAHTGLLRCPAFKDLSKNTFFFSSSLPIDGVLQDSNFISNIEQYINVNVGREPSFNNRLHINASLSWVFFSNESIHIEAKAPYVIDVPHHTYGEFIPGTFDIGSWFRPINGEFLLRSNVKEFKIAANEPIFFLKILTDRPVIFKRFYITQEIRNISITCAQAPTLFGVNIPLVDRYSLFKKTSLDKKLFKLIQEASVD